MTFPGLVLPNGDAWKATLTLSDYAATDPVAIVGVTPPNIVEVDSADAEALFPEDAVVQIVGNESAATNGRWAVASVAGQTVTLDTTGYSPIGINPAPINTFGIMTDLLAEVPIDSAVVLSGNSVNAANKVYTVTDAYWTGATTVITVTPDIPAGAGSGTLGLVTPCVVQPEATPTGTVQRTTAKTIDLSTATITAVIRDSRDASGTVLLTLTVAKTSAGLITLSTAAYTATTATVGWLDIKIVAANGVTLPAIVGVRFNQDRITYPVPSAPDSTGTVPLRIGPIPIRFAPVIT